MIRLVWAQLATRWSQALMLLLLSAAATAAAVSVPAYAGVADRAVIDAELAAADRTELFIAVGPRHREWSLAPSADPAVALLSELDGFATVERAEVPVSGLEAADRLVAWQDYCERVVVREGRCPVGNREVALPPGPAAAAGLRPGDEIVLTPTDPTTGHPAAGGAAFTVVGIVDPRDPADPVWGPHDRDTGDVVYTTPNTIARLEHSHQVHTVVAVLDPAYLTGETVPALRAELPRVFREGARLSASDGGGSAPRSELPRLLDRITSGGTEARQLLPLAGVPLLALCWFVVHLAASAAAAGRRPELGAVAVRGAPASVRATLAGAELVLPVLAGAPLGVAAGRAAVAAATSGGVPPAAAHWAAAGLALAGSLLAVLVAVRRELTAPAVALLRWVPASRRRWALATAEALTVALAVAAVVQLRAFDGDLVGLTGLAPALVMLTVAVLAGRAAWPVLHLAGQAALRAGRLGPAVAAMHLARGPATARLVMVIAVVLGMLGFAAAAADLGGQQRAGHAERVTGAARVLEVERVERARLLAAVRHADPTGAYAMAVVASSDGPDPPRLAVDSPRLAAVAAWPAGSGELDAAVATDLLRPPAPEPMRVRDGPLTVELGVPDAAGPLITLSLSLVSDQGARPVVTFGPLPPGRSVHRMEVNECPDGCRLAYLSVSVSEPGPAVLTWHGVEQDGQDLVPAGWGAGPWREVTTGGTHRVTTDSGAAVVTVTVAGARSGTHYRVLPPDAPRPLPAVVAGELATDEITNVDNQPVPVTAVGHLTGLPRFGGSGVLVDLEYAERSAFGSGTAGSSEVWLAADAPAGMVDRLAAAGLTVTGERTAAGLRSLLDGSGPAAAARYHLLAAGMAALVSVVALGQVSIAGRGAGTVSLRRLRAQGLSRRAVTATVLWWHGALVLVGTVTGVLAGAAGWLAIGDRMPVGVEPWAAVWPRPGPVLVPWLAAVAALSLAAAAAAVWQRAAAGREVGR